jgi:hypothetical protein
MRAEVLWRSKDGTPERIAFADGFAEWTEPYNADEHGWVDKMLDPDDFPAIRAGREMEMLVELVNQLQRENFRLKRSERKWMDASCFRRPDPVTNNNKTSSDGDE